MDPRPQIQEYDAILATVNGFFNWTNTRLVETIYYAHDDNELGSVKSDQGIMKQAFKTGVRISKRGTG